MAQAMKSAKVVFDDFSGGDYGRNWAGSDTPNMFRAINVIPYPGGWIGPRQPLRLFTLPVTANTLPSKALWFVENEIMLMSDGYAWNIQTGERSVTALSDVTVLRDFSVSHKQNGEMFAVSSDRSVQASTVIAIHAGGLADTVPYFIDRTTVGPTPMPNCHRIGNLEDSDVVAVWRYFYWASLNQAAVWNATDFNLVGRIIYDLVDQKNTLVFLVGARVPNTVSAGTLDLSVRGGFTPGILVYVLYGTLSTSSATFRQVATALAPEATDSGSFMWNANGGDVWWFNDRWLVSFDGADAFTQDAPLPRLLHSTTNYSYGPDSVVHFWCQASGKGQNEFIMAGSLGNNGGNPASTPDATTRRGVFCWVHGLDQKGPTSNIYVTRNTALEVTCHDPGIEFRADPGVDDAGTRDGSALSRRGDGNFYVWRRGENAMVFTTQGSTAHTEAPKFYEMDLKGSFPDYTHNDGDTGATVKADFRTADYWDPEGQEIYVDGIFLDYAYSPNGSQSTNQTVTVEIESLQLTEEAAPRAGGSVTFTPPTGTPSEPGSQIVRGRVRLPVRSVGAGGGFRVHLSNWKGITIRRITADVRLTAARI